MRPPAEGLEGTEHTRAAAPWAAHQRQAARGRPSKWPARTSSRMPQAIPLVENRRSLRPHGGRHRSRSSSRRWRRPRPRLGLPVPKRSRWPAGPTSRERASPTTVVVTVRQRLQVPPMAPRRLRWCTHAPCKEVAADHVELPMDAEELPCSARMRLTSSSNGTASATPRAMAEASARRASRM